MQTAEGGGADSAEAAMAEAPVAEEASSAMDTESTQDSSAGSPSASMEEDENDEPPTQTLWCSGDAPGSPQQHNFEGIWTLLRDHTGSPVEGGRPAYEHHAPDGTQVHLFFVESTPAGPAPRWVIGPTPGNGASGWAYSDSTAARPEDILEPWHSWVREISDWAEARLAFSAKSSMVLGGSYDESAAPESPEAHGERVVAKKKKGGGGTKKKGAGGVKGQGKAKGGAKVAGKATAAKAAKGK
jgi:hypothetical protein